MRWIFRGFTIIAVLAVLSVFAIALIPGKKLAEIAAARIEALTGREVTLTGDVKTKIFPRLSITTGPVTIANADWAKSNPMLTAQGLSLGVELLPLLQGVFEFRDVKILHPNIRFEVAKDGQKNWDFATKTKGQTTGQTPTHPPATATESPPQITVEFAAITQGEFHYTNHATGQHESLHKVDFEARFPEVEGEIRVSLKGLYKDARLDIQAALDRPMRFLLGDIATLNTTVTLEGAKLSYAGKLGLSGLVMDGALDSFISNPSALLNRLTGATMPPQDSLSVKGKLVRTANGATFVRGGEFRLGSQVLRGDVDVKTGKDRPQIKGVLTADDLSLPALQGQGAQTQPRATINPSGWSKALIDVSGLFAADAEVSLTAASLDLGPLQTGATQILMQLNAGRAVFDLKKISAYGGALSGEFVVNGRGGLSVGGDLHLQGVQTDQLLGALVGFDRLESPANIKVKFLGVGNSLDAIVKSLSGQGALRVHKGLLQGIDVAQMIRKLDLKYQGQGQRTVFESITANFVMEKGIVSGDDLKFTANGVTARGQGKIDLGQKTLDYRLVPTALASASGQGGVRVPLIIRGPWSKPQFSLDLQAIVDQELSDEKAALEAKLKKARETAKADAAQKLGVTQNDGESLEDAARRTIEENAAKELLKLLGQN